MHDTAKAIGSAFFRNYLGDRPPGRILDVGGLDVNGSLRTAAPAGWTFVCVDLAEGRGVDVVLNDPYRYPFEDESFDAVVSTSCFEHDSLFWLSFLEMLRVLREGGLIYINAPSNGEFHRYPVDCWRFYPDAGGALLKWARRSGFQVQLCESFVAGRGREGWCDFVAVFRKGAAAAEAVPLHSGFKAENILVGDDPTPRAMVALPKDLRELRKLRKRLSESAARDAAGRQVPAEPGGKGS